VTLVSPLLLLLGLLAIPLVLAFLRRPPPRRRRVSSLLLVRALATASARRRRPPPRELLSLLLMLLAMLVAIAGLALRPDPPPRGLLVVFDSSAAAAQRRERDLVDLREALQDRPAATVSLASTAPARLLRHDSDDHEGILAVASALPTVGEDGDLAALLAPLCTAQRPPVLLVLFDVDGDSGWLDALGCPVQAPERPAARDNEGLTALSARRSDGLGLVEVYLAASAPGLVTLRADGAPVGRVTLGEEAEALVRLDLPGASALSAEYVVTDRWRGDDRATVDLPQVSAVRALLLTEQPDSFAAAALAAHPGVDLTIATAPPAGAARWDLLVVESALTEPLPDARRVVVLGADPTLLGIGRAAVVRRPQVRVEKQRAPLLQYVDLTELYIGSGWTLRPPEGAEVLLASPRGPLALTAPLPDGGEALVLGFPLTDTDLVLRTAFVNLVANIVEWSRPAPAVGAQGVGVLSTTETHARPLDAVTAPGRRVPRTASLAALAAFILLSLEWLLQCLWRERP
jgi:hypothetical protein